MLLLSTKYSTACLLKIKVWALYGEKCRVSRQEELGCERVDGGVVGYLEIRNPRKKGERMQRMSSGRV